LQVRVLPLLPVIDFIIFFKYLLMAWIGIFDFPFSIPSYQLAGFTGKPPSIDGGCARA
jgi:hypothetical protein